MKNSEPVLLFVSPLLRRGDRITILPNDITQCYRLVICRNLFSEKLLRVTLNPLAPFQGRSFVGECLCCLWVTPVFLILAVHLPFLLIKDAITFPHWHKSGTSEEPAA